MKNIRFISHILYFVKTIWHLVSATFSESVKITLLLLSKSGIYDQKASQ
jgi:hypothetical protein